DRHGLLLGAARLVRRQAHVREARRWLVAVADQLHQHDAARLAHVADVRADGRAGHGQAGLVQAPQGLVLAEHPEALLGALTRPRALAHGLRHAHVVHPVPGPVAGVVLERAQRAVGVELGDEAEVAALDDVDHRLLAAAQRPDEGVEVAAVEEPLHVGVGEPRRRGGSGRGPVVPDDLAHRAALHGLAGLASGLRRAVGAVLRAYAVVGVLVVFETWQTGPPGTGTRGSTAVAPAARRCADCSRG